MVLTALECSLQFSAYVRYLTDNDFLPESGTPSPVLQSITNSNDTDDMSISNQVEFSQELMPTESLVQLPSKAKPNSTQPPIFVVHAIEGVVAALKSFAAELSYPVWGLQCVENAPLDTINDLAAFYVKQMRTVQKKGPYTVAGYSFGAAVAFEMVTQLEEADEKCNLVMLDGSPRYVSWYTESQNKRTSIAGSQAQGEAYCLAYFAMVAGSLDYATVAKELEILNTWEDRLNACAELVHKSTRQDKKLVRNRGYFFIEHSLFCISQS